MKRFSRLVCNLLPGGCRFDKLEGREHIVVPMVMLTEGVHSGSMGPLYYSKEELGKTPAVWNHKPIVVYHPTMNGESLSACDPVILNSRKVGVILNTKFEDGKLKAEAWIEKDRANLVDERVMHAVENKEMMELSTGVFIDVENEKGKWGKEEYVGITRNYRPDHLALLPDQKGACSIEDGAGFIRNHLVNNEMSYASINSAICRALQEEYEGAMYSYPYVCDVYANFFIYDYKGKYWKRSYSVQGNNVTLGTEEPVEVRRMNAYATAEGKLIGNDESNQLGTAAQSVQPTTASNNNTMKKPELIAAIIALNVGWADKDKPTLETMDEKQLSTIHNAYAKKGKDDDDDEEEDGKKKKGKSMNVAATTAPAAAPTGTAPATNAQPEPEKVITLADYIGKAPKEVQEVLQNSMSVYNDQKAQLIEVILANKQNIFKKEDLEGRPLNELKGMARLAATPEQLETAARPQNFAGLAPTPAANAQSEEPLEVPVMNFTRGTKPAEAAKN